MINRRHFSIGLGAGLAAATGPVLAQSASEGPIVLGQSAPFTGAAAQLGIQYHAGAKLHFDRVNAQGGIGRRRIELRKLDDGYEPDRCVANTHQLIADDVFALFGYVGTPTSVAALPVATRSHVPFLAPLTGAMALREPFNRYAFHVRASYDDETALIVRQLTNLGLKRIAVFYQNDSYGQAGLSGVNAALASKDLKPVALATVERNSTDVAAAVRSIVAATPEAVVQISAYKSCAAFVRGARKAGFGGTFFNVSFVGTQALSDELGKDGAGVVVSQVLPSPYNMAGALAREFAEAIKSSGGEVSANYSSFEGYLAARVVSEGMRRASSRTLTRDGLMSALESMGNMQIGNFSLAFSPTNHVASKFVELSMLTGDGKVRT